MVLSGVDKQMTLSFSGVHSCLQLFCAQMLNFTALLKYTVQSGALVEYMLPIGLPEILDDQNNCWQLQIWWHSDNHSLSHDQLW